MDIVKDVISVLFSIALFINAILFIPQAIRIFKEKSARSISLSTFSGFLLIQLMAVSYGITQHDQVLIYGYLISMVTCGSVVMLTLFYNNNKTEPEEVIDKINTLEQIISLMPAHVYWMNKSNVYMGCNDKMAESSGLKSRHDIIGKRNADLPWNIDAGSLPYELDRVNTEVMKSGRASIVEEPGTLADGTEVVYLSSKVPLRNQKNEIVGIVGISVDITPLKNTEKALLIAKEKSEAANEAKAEFIRNMEHQLRTPFSGVYSIVQMLCESETDPGKKELLDITYKSAKEFLDLLNRIINFSRDQMYSDSILSKKFELKTTIESAVSMEKAAAVIKNLSLTCIYQDDTPTVFLGDPNRIQRLVLNLLSNAIKFTPEGGNTGIEVKLAKQIDDRQCVIQIIISDSGIGIPEEKQQYIYEKFYRLYPANQNKFAGAGLGLYSVKQIIDDLEGEIEVISAPGKGSTFICTLPFKRPLLDEMMTTG